MAAKLSLKLLVDKNNKKVLFAEASKDFVDFLFSLMALPIGYTTRLLTSDNMVGSAGKLYSSIQNLSEPYLQSGLDKDLLLKPKAALLPTGPNPPLLLQNDDSTLKKSYYGCSGNSGHFYVTEVSGTLCPSCHHSMARELNFVAPKAVEKGLGVEGGFVKGVVTYMVMDDLEVSPMSTISSITILNKFNVKDLGALEEKMVEVGVEEGTATFTMDEAARQGYNPWNGANTLFIQVINPYEVSHHGTPHGEVVSQGMFS